LATDTETAAAISSHNTAANGHVGRGTTANKPGSPSVGDLYYDTTLGRLEVYTSTGWAIYLSLTSPGAPTSVSGTSGNTQVSLSWSAPSSDGGSTITDYVVQYSSNAGSTWTTFSDGTSTSTSATVTGLTNDTSYIFRVAATNSVGTGSYSTSSSSVTPSNPILVDYLVVAGAGGGARGGGNNRGGGGGGAGGYRTGTQVSFARALQYTITVGAGGSGAPANSTPTDGANSVFATVTSTGGGRAGDAQADRPSSNGKTGGSGGGGTSGSNTAETGYGGTGNVLEVLEVMLLDQLGLRLVMVQIIQ
jgi:hypothetical protein